MVVRTILSMVFVDFILVGVIVATAIWAISNRFLTHSSHTHATEQTVEWCVGHSRRCANCRRNFCFDIHVNAFLPILLELCVEIRACARLTDAATLPSCC